MDTTPEYVEMCRKAEEIQKQSPFTADDTERVNGFVYDPDGGDDCKGAVVSIGEANNQGGSCDCCSLVSPWRDGIIWLPRQDQLIEMFHRGLSAHGLISVFSIWAEQKYGYYYGFIKAALGVNPSMEQLWLAFVMHQTYGKSWDADKKEWVKNGR